MPEPVNPTAIGQSCRCLRSKEMFYEVERDAAAPPSGSGIYWCIHTHNCLGPDGQIAEPASCQPGRSCFEPL